MWYRAIIAGIWRIMLSCLLLVIALTTLPIHPTLAVNSTGPLGSAHTDNPPCGLPTTPRERSIDGIPVKVEGPRGAGSAYNPTQAQLAKQPGNGNKAANMADLYWSVEGAVREP